MQLKIRRSQRDGGVLSKTAIFCIDAMVQLTPEELKSVTRYKLQNQVIYNSEAAKRNLERVEKHAGTGALGEWKALGFALVANLNLNISIRSLQEGHHIECKSLEELLGAEEALMSACKNLTQFLETAATFDGREVLINFDVGGEPVLVASSVTPQPMLVMEPKAQPALARADASAADYIAAPATGLAATATAEKGLDDTLKVLLFAAGMIGIFVMSMVWLFHATHA